MKRFWIASAALLLLGFGSGTAWAQAGAARGTVVDAAGEPIAEATVAIEYLEGLPISFETQTNDSGQFTQVGLRSGRYKFTVTKEGYRGTFIEHSITVGEPTRLPPIQLLAMEQARAQQAEEDGQTIATRFNEGIAMAQAGQFDEAAAVFNELLETVPEFPEAHFNLGYIHSQRQEWVQAEAEYKLALEQRPDYPDAKMALSSVYQRTGRGDEAAALIADAAREGSAGGQVFFNLGIVHLNAGKQVEAIEAFKKAEELDPDNPEIQYYLATLLVGQGATDEAVERLEKYLAMSPENPQNVATAQGLLQALKK